MANPQKRGPTTRTYIPSSEAVPSRYKTPRPYAATPVVTVRSLVNGAPTVGTNGNNRPPVCTGNEYRKPTDDFDRRVVRANNRNAKPKPSPGDPFGRGSI